VRARLGEIDGEPVCWLTATGHQAAGKTRGNEVRPTSDSLSHALAPSRLAKWLQPLAPQLALEGVELSVTWGPSCRAFSERVISLAWARLKSLADPSGTIGLLTGGLIPDALLIERRTIDQTGEANYLKCWGNQANGLDELAETIVAIEVQNATRQASDPLRSKVDAWSTAIEKLNVASSVLWIVEPGASKVLTSLGVGDPSRRPGQLLISSGAVGLSGDNFLAPGPEWWVMGAHRNL